MVVGSGAWLGQRTGEMARIDPIAKFPPNTSREYFAADAALANGQRTPRRRRESETPAANLATPNRSRCHALEPRLFFPKSLPAFCTHFHASHFLEA